MNVRHECADEESVSLCVNWLGVFCLQGGDVVASTMSILIFALYGVAVASAGHEIRCAVAVVVVHPATYCVIFVRSSCTPSELVMSKISRVFDEISILSSKAAM